MIKDLTKQKWNKYRYYTSEGIIFAISSKALDSDLDECSTYLINLSVYEPFVNAKDGSVLNLTKYPNSFKNFVPYIRLKFKRKTSSSVIYKYFPLQYLIEKGDKVENGVVGQLHPNVYDNDYAIKFNNEVFSEIKSIVNRESNISRSFNSIMNSLPDWLTGKSGSMTEYYIDNYFCKGYHYNEAEATRTPKDGSSSVLYDFQTASIGIGDDIKQIDLWNEDNVRTLLSALYAEKAINSYTKEMNLSLEDEFLSQEAVEALASSFVENMETSTASSLTLRSLLHIEYNSNGSVNEFNVENKSTKYDTWEEYLNPNPDPYVPPTPPTPDPEYFEGTFESLIDKELLKFNDGAKLALPNSNESIKNSQFYKELVDDEFNTEQFKKIVITVIDGEKVIEVTINPSGSTQDVLGTSVNNFKEITLPSLTLSNAVKALVNNQIDVKSDEFKLVTDGDYVNYMFADKIVVDGKSGEIISGNESEHISIP